MQDYKKIAAWRKAHALLINVHREIRTFPREYGNLRSQIRRSAESIPSNVVEGAGKESQKEFARFLDSSICSANETEYWLRVARDYGVMADTTWRALTGDVIEVRRMLYGLLKRVREGLE